MFDKKKNALKTHKGAVENNWSPKKKSISLKTDLIKVQYITSLFYFKSDCFTDKTE